MIPLILVFVEAFVASIGFHLGYWELNVLVVLCGLIIVMIGMIGLRINGIAEKIADAFYKALVWAFSPRNNGG